MADKNDSTTNLQTGTKMNKNEAVRQALKTLGGSATRTEIKDFVKKEFGIEMSADHVSTSKAEALRKMAAKGEAPTKPTAPKPSAKKAAAKTTQPRLPKPVAKSANGKKIMLKDILTLEDLVKRVGAAELLTLIDVIAK